MKLCENNQMNDLSAHSPNLLFRKPFTLISLFDYHHVVSNCNKKNVTTCIFYTTLTVGLNTGNIQPQVYHISFALFNSLFL